MKSDGEGVTREGHTRTNWTEVFGGVRPGTPTKDAEAWKKWASDHPFGRIEGDPPNRVGFEAVYEDDIAMRLRVTGGPARLARRQVPGLIFPGDTTYRDQIAHVP